METNSSCCHSNQEPTKHPRDIKMEVNDNSVRQSMFDISYNRHQQQTEVVMSSAPSTPSKHMDTSHEEVIDDYGKHQNYCGDTVVLLGTDSSGSLVSKSDGSSIINGGFFNETLDLSQEDIQRTLSANMPMCSTELNNHQRHSSENSNNIRHHSIKVISHM